MNDIFSAWTMFTILDQIKRYCLNPNIKPKQTGNKVTSIRAYNFKKLLNLIGSLEDIMKLFEFVPTRLQAIDIKDLYMYSLRVSEY